MTAEEEAVDQFSNIQGRREMRKSKKKTKWREVEAEGRYRTVMKEREDTLQVFVAGGARKLFSLYGQGSETWR